MCNKEILSTCLKSFVLTSRGSLFCMAKHWSMGSAVIRESKCSLPTLLFGCYNNHRFEVLCRQRHTVSVWVSGLDLILLIFFISLLSIKVTVLPVSINAPTRSLFKLTVLMGRGDGFGVVKQHERTVQKLMMAVGRVIEQTSLHLSSFPNRVPRHLLLHLLLVRIRICPQQHFGLS